MVGMLTGCAVGGSALATIAPKVNRVRQIRRRMMVFIPEVCGIGQVADYKLALVKRQRLMAARLNQIIASVKLRGRPL